MLKLSMTTGGSQISKLPFTNAHRRDKIINVLKMAYTSIVKHNLPVYGLKNKELREFTTTAQDKDKGLSRIPLPLARIYEEDILDEQESDQIVLSEPLDNYSIVME
jgi:hypothetical protein